ncbi:endolytic transglycosylase MltG [Deinococcus sp.]|uniref:endolytic transglycosylase MltG n=1 Tax=Deinococcus sp. TaxID=47478 RepID=UPI0025C2AA36|nr:endolytic transglycosylase MltG [Deinococcus sp.]
MTRLKGNETPAWTRILVGLLALLLLLGLITLIYVRSLFGPAGGGKYTLQVSQGETVGQVAADLQAHHIIKNARALRYIMGKNGSASKLKEGAYDLSGTMTAQQVANVLAGPARLAVIKVTIPEGRRIRDIPAIFDKAGYDGKAIATALTDVNLSRYAHGKQPNLEGFIFPSTYEFRPKDSSQAIVKKMVARMEQEFTPANIAKARALGLSVRGWVILASMVQAEAASNNDMPIIAGVFLNRLKEDIALGSDPTVAYGLGKNLPELDRSAGDFQKDTPYSTYTRKGLPAGPINNPGEAALLAAINPQLKMADGRDALYFLHVPGGKIYVNHTYAEHLRDNAQHR